MSSHGRKPDQKLKIVPLKGSQDTKTAFRVHLSPETLEKLDLKIGQLCHITTDADAISGYGIAWRGNDSMDSPKKASVKMSEVMRNTFGFKENQQVTISKAGNPILFASTVVLNEITPPEYETIIDEHSILATDAMPGLSDQVKEISTHLATMLRSRQGDEASKGKDVTMHMIIHGYEGTGKSMLLQKLEQSKSCHVFRIDKTKLQSAKISSAIRDTFHAAVKAQPSLIIIDNIEKLASSSNDATVGLLCDEVRNLKKERVIVVAATRDLDDLHGRVTMECCKFEVELPIPDARARREILASMLELPVTTELVRTMGYKTHGFTGSALLKVVEHTQVAAKKRLFCAPQAEEITLSDFLLALKRVKPNALGGFIVTKPETQWSDIGGSESLREQVDELIGELIGDLPPDPRYPPPESNSILLYGPPGCSKTMTAKAIANTYHVNFISIKGSELVNMYIGESERGMRKLFAKARQAKPCIIFFDEFEAIGKTRESKGPSGLNLVQTLLTEMDGFEAASGVVVIAATNFPQALDEALLRPGRFDDLIYVGLPELQGRREIIKIALSKVPCDKIDLDAVAEATEGYSGAEISGICKKAVTMAKRRAGDEKIVMQNDLMTAVKERPQRITQKTLQAFEAFKNRRIS
ncbi:AAA-domain-containing protein, partial [Piedraia hortae CBS 480.64]